MVLFEKFHSGHKGYGLRATTFIKKGTLLLTELPFAHAISENVQKNICNNCMKRSKLKCCSGCKQRFYCSQKCQKAMWPLHKHECLTLKNVQGSKGATNFLMLLYQVLIKLKSKIDWEKEGYIRTVSDLNADCEFSDEDEIGMQQTFVKLKVMSEEGRCELPQHLTSYQQIRSLMSKLRCNIFGIQDEEFTNINGIGLYLNCSLFNHDCQPNCVQIFPTSKVEIRTLRDIQVGEELTITYCYLPACSAVRQEYLRSYHFTCSCDACKHKKYDKEMLSDRNGLEMGEEQIQVSSSFLEKLNELREKNEDEKILRDGKTFITEQNFDNGNVFKLQILDRMGSAAVRLGDYDVALEYYLQLLPFYSKYAPLHPIIGLTHATIGKILAFQKRSEDAMIHLKQAWARLCITHSGDSSVVQECDRMLKECEMVGMYQILDNE